jgi:FtsZ-interacting cell division protein ZipA
VIWWKLIILGVVALLVAAVLVEVWMKRNKPRASLADTLGKASKSKADDKPALGMEEIDMDVVRAAERLDTTLERKNSIHRK